MRTPGRPASRRIACHAVLTWRSRARSPARRTPAGCRGPRPGAPRAAPARARTAARRAAASVSYARRLASSSGAQIELAPGRVGHLAESRASHHQEPDQRHRGALGMASSTAASRAISAGLRKRSRWSSGFIWTPPRPPRAGFSGRMSHSMAKPNSVRRARAPDWRATACRRR